MPLPVVRFRSGVRLSSVADDKMSERFNRKHLVEVDAFRVVKVHLHLVAIATHGDLVPEAVTCVDIGECHDALTCPEVGSHSRVGVDDLKQQQHVVLPNNKPPEKPSSSTCNLLAFTGAVTRVVL